ncbi:MAG: peroxidase-related enzyme [Candidatus Bipolaricaulota bacterium]
MSWIRVVDEQQAGEELRTIYERLKSNRGKVSNILAVHSLDPRAMAAHMNLYMTIMFGRSGLSREEREVVAVVVSAANSCDYCIAHHAEALHHYWKDRERLQALIDDPRSIDLTPRMRALADYALKLTESPCDMVEADIEELRGHGLGDEDILAVNLVASYFNFVNRIALGLGVEATSEEAAGYKY